MKELIDKLLNEQTTPEEEHLIAQMLRKEEDIEQWLTEDETETYDHLVSQQKSRRRAVRWAVAAVLAVVIAAGGVILWPREAAPVDRQPVATNQAPLPVISTHTDSTQPVAKQAQPKKALHRSRKATVATKDSLEYYIARLEKELDEVTDSTTYTAKAEEIIRADARLQKLIQRIMIGELTKDDQHIESMNIIKEEQP